MLREHPLTFLLHQCLLLFSDLIANKVCFSLKYIVSKKFLPIIRKKLCFCKTKVCKKDLAGGRFRDKNVSFLEKSTIMLDLCIKVDLNLHAKCSMSCMYNIQNLMFH